MIKSLFFTAVTIIFATLASRDVDAVQLTPQEPLTSKHLSDLLLPLLPAVERDRRRKFEFATPTLPLANPNSIHSDISVVTFDHDPDSGRFSGEVYVRFSADSGGRLQMLGRIHEEILLPVLTKGIAKGERVEPDMISLEWVADRHLAHDVVVDSRELIGLEATRRIPTGRPLRGIDLREPTLIRRGEIIELIYRNNGLYLSAMARAKQSGAMGDIIAVSNVDSGKDLRALVAGRKRAEIYHGGVAHR